MAGVAAGGPSAKTANPQVLPGGLATPGVHIHRWYEARSHHGGSRFDDRGIVRREHQQRSAHASAHAEKGARVAAALYRSDCQTRRGTGAGRVDRAVDGATDAVRTSGALALPGEPVRARWLGGCLLIGFGIIVFQI